MVGDQPAVTSGARLTRGMSRPMPSCGAPKVVALLGVAGSGKSIVTRRLLAAGFTRVRFGDAARDMLTAGFGCLPSEIDGDDRDLAQRRFGGHSVLSLMQSLTHDWGRASIHSDIWANEWRRRIAPLDGFVFADDLQRVNEAAEVREAGGIIVRITRPGYAPARQGRLHQQARITADLELLNEGPAKLLASTEQFIDGLNARLASAA